MSDRIDEILAVLKLIRNGHSNGMTLAQLSEVRKNSVYEVAHRLNIDHTTVSDKFRRQLKPEIKDTKDFDHAVHVWLDGNPKKLHSAMISHCVGPADRAKVNSFFS